jgi:hypothetical protein
MSKNSAKAAHGYRFPQDAPVAGLGGALLDPQTAAALRHKRKWGPRRNPTFDPLSEKH